MKAITKCEIIGDAHRIQKDIPKGEEVDYKGIAIGSNERIVSIKYHGELYYTEATNIKLER